jgi:tRNA U34 5-carboxymethylaminomethyl modifying GTPase MnmE/TrmE
MFSTDDTIVAIATPPGHGGLGRIRGPLARAAFDPLDGTLSGAIGVAERELFDLAARLEASLSRVEALLAGGRRGRAIREGRQAATAGRPSSCKSSLFNTLLGSKRARAIVTAVPGLSREAVERLSQVQPATLGQAQRIPVVTPAAVAVLAVHLERAEEWPP